jgi:hypothetical protein
MGRISNTYATPLPALLAMPWDEALRWYPEALKVYEETWGRRT